MMDKFTFLGFKISTTIFLLHVLQKYDKGILVCEYKMCKKI